MKLTFDKTIVASGILLFRGTAVPPDWDRLGKWWTTNPYYAIGYGSSKQGQIFVANISSEELNEGLDSGQIVDVTQDEYKNYAFRASDPPGARPVSEEELQQFTDRAQATAPPIPQQKRPGMQSVRPQLQGQEALDSGYQIIQGF